MATAESSASHGATANPISKDELAALIQSLGFQPQKHRVESSSPDMYKGGSRGKHNTFVLQMEKLFPEKCDHRFSQNE